LWNSIQSWLFPALEDEIGALDEKADALRVTSRGGAWYDCGNY